MRIVTLILLAVATSAAIAEDALTFDQRFDLMRSDRQKLHTLFRAMPLGGDTHTHLSGAVSADALIEIAGRNHYYFAFSTEGKFLAFVAPKIILAKDGSVTFDFGGRCSGNTLCLQSDSLTNKHRDQIRQAIWITDADPQRGEKKGKFADFVRVFGVLDELTDNSNVMPELIHALMDEASGIRVSYLELKMTPYGRRNRFGAVVPIETLLNDLRSEIDAKNRALARAGKPTVVVKLVAQLLRSRLTRTGGITNLPYIGCSGSDCATRWEQAHYLVSLSRFSDFLVGYDFVGLPEVKLELPNSTAKKMIRELTAKYGDANIAIHSGESDETKFADNIALALDAGADRLGHAYNLSSKVSSETRDLVCQGNTPMVIGLSSNVRLQVAPTIDDHPFVGVIRGDICAQKKPLPVALATDDAGLFNTDLALEFCIAAANSNLTWQEMKQLAKQSLLGSFAPAQEKAQLVAEWERDIREFEENWVLPTDRSQLAAGCPDPT